MRTLETLFLIASAVCVCGAGRTAEPPPTPVKPASPAPAAAQAGTVQEVNDRYARQILEKIAGRENDPAGQVFKNIQVPGLKAVPAKNLLLIMNLGYSRALGVSCTHCHVESDFASDDQRPKRAAREMAAMNSAINEQLGKMKNLEPRAEKAVINCSTCHRGAINPMASER